jgi:hypothetical protein
VIRINNSAPKGIDAKPKVYELSNRTPLQNITSVVAVHKSWAPGGKRFSAPVQTGPGAHPTSSTMGNGTFPVVKRPGRGVDHPPHLAPRLKEE